MKLLSRQTVKEHERIWKRLLRLEEQTDMIASRLLRLEREKGIYRDPPRGNSQ